MRKKILVALCLFVGAGSQANAQDLTQGLLGNVLQGVDNLLVNVRLTGISLIEADVSGTTQNLGTTLTTLTTDLTMDTQLEPLGNGLNQLTNQLIDSSGIVTPTLDNLAAPVGSLSAPFADLFASSTAIIANGVPILPGLIAIGQDDAEGGFLGFLTNIDLPIISPLLGSLGGAMVLPAANQPMTVAELPLPSESFDRVTLTGLLNGATLRGL